MHIPIQVDYGVRALIDLAGHSSEGVVRTSDIARRQGIPEPFLARVLHTLGKHGLTSAQRGPYGGHSLAKDPSQITMGAVMGFLADSQRLIGCLDNPGQCNQSPVCGQREVWGEVERAIQRVLDDTSITDLVNRMNQYSQEIPIRTT